MVPEFKETPPERSLDLGCGVRYQGLFYYLTAFTHMETSSQEVG